MAEEEEEKTPEERLADYWRAKTGLDWSDFDVFSGKRPTLGTSCRAPALDFKQRGLTIEVAEDAVGWNLLKGYPLSREEYYFALARHLVLSDLPYEQFFQTRWWENADQRGYGVAL